MKNGKIIMKIPKKNTKQASMKILMLLLIAMKT